MPHFLSPLLFKSSLDPLLAAEAFVSAIYVSSILCKATRPRLQRRIYRKLLKVGRRVVHKSSDYDSAPTYVTHLEHANRVNKLQNPRNEFKKFTKFSKGAKKSG